MGIGLYRHVVTLEDPRVELDPPTWFCAVQSAGLQVVEGVAGFYVQGRYHPGITLDTRIHFEGSVLQVQAIEDVDLRHEDLRLSCVEVVARGRNASGV